jgi:hypothetical protein
MSYTDRMAKRIVVVPPIAVDFKEAVTRLLKVKPPERAPRKRATAKRKAR